MKKRNKYTIEYIREVFEKENYILLTDKYINNKMLLYYICPEGHHGSVRWDNWLYCHNRCWQCSGVMKLSIDEIRKDFEAYGYKLLSKKYLNANKKLDYICPEGHKHSMTYAKFKTGRRCPTCANLFKRGNQVRLDYEYIKSSFEKEGYKLLSKEYRNARSNLDYICPNNHKSKITWDSWNSGHRCKECSYDIISLRQMGENNPNWQGGLSFEPYCPIWKDVSYKEFIKYRDGNICLNPHCLKNYKKLTVHHVDYDKKNCGHTNLITLCPSCNARANKDRKWHKAWYQAILNKRYGYTY